MNVINMYGDLEIYIFRVRLTKGNPFRRQWIDVKFDVMGMQRIFVCIKLLTFDSGVMQKVLSDEKVVNEKKCDFSMNAMAYITRST